MSLLGRLSFFRGTAPQTTDTDTGTALVPVRAARRPGRALMRLFKAAVQDRFTADWLATGGDLNSELRAKLPIIRARARELEQNSNLARRFLALCETHIVGPDGFTLMVQGRLANGKLDSRKNKLIENDFWRWGRRGICEVTGHHSFESACRVSVRTAARDGEMLIRMHDVRPTARNPWGFVIELLDPARLDHQLNEDLSNGHRIRLGVELNAAGAPVAYWLRKGERKGSLFVSRDKTHERVPYEDLIHWFEADQPEQLRGVSWMVSGMFTVKQIDGFQEAAITAARAGASKMGFYKKTLQGPGDLAALGDDVEDDGDVIQEFEPAHMGELPFGWDFVGFDPKYPHENYEPFIKTNHRDIAMGWGVSYHALTGDLRDVNFSSIRQGTLEERERWKVKQDNTSAGVLERIFHRWFSAAVFNGRFGDVDQAVFMARYSEHYWQGRRWSWVDPLKDIQAMVEAINAGLTSPQRIAAELGIDIEELLEQIAEWQRLVQEKGISFPVVLKSAPVSGGKDDGKQNQAAAED